MPRPEPSRIQRFGRCKSETPQKAATQTNFETESSSWRKSYWDAMKSQGQAKTELSVKTASSRRPGRHEHSESQEWVR